MAQGGMSGHDLVSGDADSQPGDAGSPAADHVARIMHADVDAAQPDEEGQQRGRGEHHSAVPAGPPRREDDRVGEKAISDLGKLYVVPCRNAAAY